MKALVDWNKVKVFRHGSHNFHRCQPLQLTVTIKQRGEKTFSINNISTTRCVCNSRLTHGKGTRRQTTQKNAGKIPLLSPHENFVFVLADRRLSPPEAKNLGNFLREREKRNLWRFSLSFFCHHHTAKARRIVFHSRFATVDDL